MKIILYLFLLFGYLQNDNFLNNQLKYTRVRTAKAQKDSIVKKMFESKGHKYPSNNIFICVFKLESQLELWALDVKTDIYELIKTYKICALSGELGPKRRRGDLQIPEGFYYISDFNPVSNFYLSLKINYPNNSDKILGYKSDLGGDIFLHGNCVTIGCIPITDELIKELYWIVVQAKEKGQLEIPVHIFPARLNNSKYDQLMSIYKNNKKLVEFWKNLKEGYDIFDQKKLLPKVEIDESGKYIFKSTG
jgi:murein L,D-transpeptidase YafK